MEGSGEGAAGSFRSPLPAASASTMARHRATRSSVVARIKATASFAFFWRGSNRYQKGSFHNGKTSVARDSVSFSAV